MIYITVICLRVNWNEITVMSPDATQGESMARARPGRGSDQFALRLPEGLRDRIKAYAAYQGRSMNEEIVRILEREFPEPWVAGERIDELLEMLGVIQAGQATNEGISKLASELHDTIEGIYSGRVQGFDQNTRRDISNRYQEWQEREFERQSDKAAAEYDAVEEVSLERTGKSEKFVYEDGSVGPQPKKGSPPADISPDEEFPLFIIDEDDK
ncbi:MULTISPECIES: Arc family DNA-binding protein [unclassified Mesorhizobium]|uniref:Arc family DNA-binding protein n=1 Tax=unclassified Mesorhizobium TaxID=325217 RepID=UPI001676DA18|nr:MULTISPECIES: Arc family DNA-binding protein [unclassified Mesorhizobium]